MDIIKSLEWRYATKKFDRTKKLSKKQLTTLKEAFSLTATSFGLQPIKLIIVENQQIKEKLVEHSYFQPQVADASHVFVICIQKDISTKDINTYFDRQKEIRGVNEETVGKFRSQLITMFNNKSIEEKQSNATKQAYIALGNLLTVCAIEKIDTCPMEGFLREKIDEILQLSEKDLKSALLLPVGFRAEDDIMSTLKKVRKPLEEVILEIN